jgi:DNA invertase Pin-like site-specific DNA recombinase
MAGKVVGYFRDGRPGMPGARGPAAAEQSRRFLEFCRAEGLDGGPTFIDPPEDPTDPPGIQQLVAYLRDREPGTLVVVSSVDRLGKDMREAARTYFKVSSLGARVVTLAGGDPLAALVQGWREREETERLGERVRAAMRRKAVKGEALGRPPYGYRVGPRHRLEPVANEAALVRYIFQLYVQDDLGIRRISRRLNEEGHRTRRGGNWSMVTIRDILRNRAYLGTYARFGVRVPGSHPALVGPDEFRKAQEKMAARRTSGGPRNVTPYLLAGLAYCGHCGNRMIGVTRRQSWSRRGDGGTSSAEYRYYQCGSRTNQSMCDYHTRTAAELDEQVRRATAAALERLVQGEALAVGDANRPDDPQKLRTRLRQLDRRLERYLDLAAAGRLSGERLRALSTAIARQQLETEDALADLTRRTSEREARSQRIEERRRQIADLTEGWDALDFAGRQALLRDVLERVNVRDDAIEVVLRQ